MKVISEDRKYLIVEEELTVTEGEQVPITWYSPLYGCFTGVRTVKVLKGEHPEEVKKFLQRGDLHIYTVADNVPVLTRTDREMLQRGEISLQAVYKAQRVKEEDGADYIDEFGRYVYVSPRIGTTGDEDRRYDGVADGELFTVKTIMHDSLHRTQQLLV